MSQLWYTTTQWGPEQFGLVASQQGLVQVVLPHQWKESHPTGITLDRERMSRYSDAFDAYWAGRLREWSLPIDLGGTLFQQLVWKALCDIPYGSVVTYGEVARRIGRNTAVRAVAAAIGQNPLPILIPCHRVIGANGTLTGYRGGLHLKERLLALEGVSHLKTTGHARFVF